MLNFDIVLFLCYKLLRAISGMLENKKKLLIREKEIYHPQFRDSEQ